MLCPPRTPKEGCGVRCAAEGGDFELCCNNVDAGRGIEFERGVYSGSGKKLYLIFHGRNASASVGTVTGNAC